MIISLFTTLMTLSILGIHLTKAYEFSEYMVLKKIKLLGFLERTENITSTIWISETYIYLTLIIYNITKNITESKKVFKTVSILTGILLVIITKTVFKNTTIYNNYIKNIFIYITSPIFIIYIITALSILIRKYLKAKQKA